MGEAAIKKERCQPRGQTPPCDERCFRSIGPSLSGLAELKRQGPVLVRGVGECVAARAGALDSRNQRGAITRLGHAHYLIQPFGQIVQTHRAPSTQTPLRNWRHETGRAGPGVWKMRHAQMPGQGNIRTVTGPLTPAQFEPTTIECY